MCGIIYIKGKKDVRQSIYEQYTRQKSRGSEGFGFIAINDVASLVRTEKEKDIFQEMKKTPTREMLFHHRMPTSTPNFAEVAHPIKVSNDNLEYDYFVVHNGIITNDNEMKKKHEAIGFKYNTEIIKQYLTSGNTYESRSFNDSEALAIEVALAIENRQADIQAKGSSAFIALQTDKLSRPIALYYGRNEGNPLILSKSKNKLMLSSEGLGELIKSHILYCYNYKTGNTTEKEMTIGDKNPYLASNWGFNYHYTEDDLTDDWIDLVEEKESLQKALSKAQQESNFDLEEELKYHLQEIDSELKLQEYGLY